MLRTIIRSIIVLLLMAPAVNLHSQCLTAPPADPCTGAEPTVSSNEILTVGVKKYYYGATASLSNITLRGGTLVICSELTINNLVLDSGIIVVRPGATLHVSNGTSLFMRGNSAIYNYGTVDILNHLQMDPGWASAAKPSVVINASLTAFFKVANNYFIINEPNARFVNLGRADFGGVITDFNSVANSICIGFQSQMNMSVMYNNKKDTYVAPYGAGCVRINTYSQLRDTLTNDPRVNLCLGGTLTKDPCGGACVPNGWGTPHVNNGCTDCATITLLTMKPESPSINKPERSNKIQVTPNPFSNAIKISWSGSKKPTAITIINTSGSIVYNTPLRADNSGVVTIPLPASWPVGGYVVKVVYPGEVLLQKMIKQSL
jgi:hypothetical protein